MMEHGPDPLLYIWYPTLTNFRGLEILEVEQTEQIIYQVQTHHDKTEIKNVHNGPTLPESLASVPGRTHLDNNNFPQT